MRARGSSAAGALALLALSSTPAGAGPPRCRGELVYFGTQQAGAGHGIGAALFDPETGRLSAPTLAAEAERPTWVLADPGRPVLYSVSEAGNDGGAQGAVLSWAVASGTGALTPLSRVASGGGGATHLALDSRSRTLFVANYGTGEVAALPADRAGRLSAATSVVADAGSGPGPRQRGPHAHASALDRAGRHLLVADLGADRVLVYRFDPATRRLVPEGAAVSPPGSGPRHLVFGGDGRFVYVTDELSGEVVAYRWTAATARLEEMQRLATNAPGYAGPKSAAELLLSRDGGRLYVSNRGEDTIVAYAVDRRTGRLTEAQRIAAGGKGPWSFAIDPAGRWMVVANQGSGTLAVLRVDPASGALAATGRSVALEKPTSIAFVGNACR